MTNSVKEVKSADKQVPEKKEVAKKTTKLSIEEKINKVEFWKDLIEERKIILNALSKLSKFKITANNDDVQFVIKNKDNLTFKTSNPEHLQMVIYYLINSITKSLKGIESEISAES